MVDFTIPRAAKPALVHTFSAGLTALLLSTASATASTLGVFLDSYVHDVAGGGIPAPAVPSTPPSAELSRITSADYGDGVGSMVSGRPNPRDLSNALSQPQNAKTDSTAQLSNLALAMLQLLASHEVAHSPTGSEDISVPVSPNDPVASQVSGTTLMPQSRSQFNITGGQRQQINDVTAIFDGSTVYGSDAATTATLRTNDGTGMMKTDPVTGGLPIIGGNPMAGDIRAAENPNLQAVHTLFLKEHNRLAGEIAAKCTSEGLTCSGDQIFDGARQLVAAAQEKIFYDELLPVFLNSNDLSTLIPDQNLASQVSGAINEFTAAAGRIGHTKVPDTIRLQSPGQAPTQVPLANCFFMPDCLGGATFEEQLFGLSQQATEPVDTVVNDTLRNALMPGFNVNFLIDLMASNINRGRDHGLPDYMTLRTALGFGAAAKIEDLLPQFVLDAYPDYLNSGVDAIVGIFAELRDPANFLGDTARAIWALQFTTLQNEHSFFDPAYGLGDYLSGVSMKGLIADNTWMEEHHLSANVFLVSGSGTNPPAVPLPAGGLLLLSGLALAFAARQRM